MQPVSKSRLRAFAAAYLRSMDPGRAAQSVGAGDGMRLLEDERAAEEIRGVRELLAKQFTPEDTVRRMVELAFGRANDCVRLALEEHPPIEALDLSLLQEIRRNDKGTVEIRLIDRMRVLERLLALERGGEDEAQAFFRAMRDSLNDLEGTD